MNDQTLQEFWEACGGVRELRLLIEHPAQPARGLIVPTPFALIGSSDSSQIFLPDDQISFRHAYLQFIAGQLWRFDLSSRTGTYWKQRRESAGIFDSSDALCVGPYELQNLVRDKVDAPASNPLLAIPAEQDSLPTVTLEFVNVPPNPRSNSAPTWRMDRVLAYAGRAPVCKVRLNCPSVSYFHCSLLRTPMGAWVVDLLGRGGIAVNDTPVRWARLRNGDHLRVGRFEIRVHEKSRRASPSYASVQTEQPTAPNRTPADAPLLPVPIPSTVQPVRELAAAPENSALTTLGVGDGMTALAWPGAVPATNPALVPSSPATGDAQSLLLNVVNQFSMMQQQMLDQFQQTTLMMLQMFSAMQKDQFELIRQELDALRELNREIHELQTELSKYRAVSKQVPFEPATIDSSPKNHAPAPGRDAPAPNETVSRSSSPNTAPPGEDVHSWLSQRFTDLQKERQSRWQKIVGTLMGK